jgi:hypothetical protein
VFFTTLIQEADPQVAVEHVEAITEPACCAFLVRPVPA